VHRKRLIQPKSIFRNHHFFVAICLAFATFPNPFAENPQKNRTKHTSARGHKEESLLSSDQDAVYEIEEALKRIEKNSFGVCELTGKAIPKTRLNAVPWARYTVSAQAKLEKDGAVRTRKLGNLGTLDGAGTNNLAVADSLDSETKPPKSKA
jgi:RNA polymerase-binding transcription factor DksA